MKKIIGSILAGVMLLSMSTVCFAAESDVDTLSTEPTDERIYVISDESLTTNKGAREPSWGKGTFLGKGNTVYFESFVFQAKRIC